MPTVISKSDPSEKRAIIVDREGDFYDILYAALTKRVKREGLLPGRFVMIMNVFTDAFKTELGYAALGELEKVLKAIRPETSSRKVALDFLHTAKVSASSALVSSKVYHNFESRTLQVITGSLQDYFKGVDPNNPKDPILKDLTIRQREGELPILNSIFDIKNSAYLSIPLIYSENLADELVGIVHIVYELNNDVSLKNFSNQSLTIQLNSIATNILNTLVHKYDKKDLPPAFS